VYSSLSAAAASRNRPCSPAPPSTRGRQALHALGLACTPPAAASRCLTSPIRSPPPPSPVCLTTNRMSSSGGRAPSPPCSPPARKAAAPQETGTQASAAVDPCCRVPSRPRASPGRTPPPLLFAGHE
ncbi:hypothetical protein PVAP13_8KG276701, partial [Panicum virgatum]